MPKLEKSSRISPQFLWRVMDRYGIIMTIRRLSGEMGIVSKIVFE
jgi:hypothetical protein